MRSFFVNGLFTGAFIHILDSVFIVSATPKGICIIFNNQSIISTERRIILGSLKVSRNVDVKYALFFIFHNNSHFAALVQHITLVSSECT
ncbi:hypothetical protein SK128_002221, partial [Halocaridina rubra]